jgi:anti-sigma factor RsiW
MTDHELTCQEFVELVTAYLERTLPEPEIARFEAHLGECPWCDRYLAQMRETIRLVGRIREESLSPEARRDMLALFRDWTREGSPPFER